MKYLAFLVLVSFVACGDDDGPTDAGADTMMSDVGTADASETDAGESDGGDDDAGESDAGDGDAGDSDAGPDDAGADTTVVDAGTDTMDSGPRSPLGTPDCASDDACETGVCWDFSDYDALCGGSVCSTTCAEDSECVDAATSAGADTPASATCGDDGRCSFIGTGLGVYFCA